MVTFGIITNNQHHKLTNQHERLSSIITSIEQQNIPKYEIIIVGDYKTNKRQCKCIDFDETIKPAWITRKKNIITQQSQYDIIVYLHDYICLEASWWKGWKNFGIDHWDVAMNIIINKDNTRFRDWVVFEFDGNTGPHGQWENTIPKTKKCMLSPYLPSYDYNKTEYMYISGSYWVAKKNVMIDEPLDEEFIWGQPEDIEWSFGRVLKKYRYVMNTKSAVRLLHQKDPVFKPLDPYYTSKEYIERFTT